MYKSRSVRRMENRGGWKPIRIEEFRESEMWDLMEEMEAIVDVTETKKKPEQGPIGLLSRQLPSAAMLIPRAKRSPRPSPEPKLAQQSEPVSIPDWSKIYGKSPIVSGYDSDSFGGKRFLVESFDDGDDDDDGMVGRTVVPPHEWLAKRQASSLSMCEGVGRTLKGRDLRRVRHAVLTKTGFI